MTDQEKLEFIRSAMIEVFKKPKDFVVRPTDLLPELGFDSLDIVELQMYYEEQTGKNTPNDARIISVSDLMEIME